MTTPETAMIGARRLSRLPRGLARIWLAGLVILPLLAAIPHAAMRMPPPPSVRVFRDDDLYAETVNRVAAGEPYYAAAADAQRRHGYPTSPGPVFREPWLTWLLAQISPAGLRAFAVYPLYVLLIAVVGREIIAQRRPLPQTAFVMAAVASGVGMLGVDHAGYFHEIWAAGLLALSLVLYRPGRPAIAIALAFAACMIRELALPALGAMALFAMREKRLREAAAWLIAILVFGLVYAAHLHATSGLARPGDLVSPGWITASGWRLVALAGRYNVALTLLPDWAVIAALVLALTGLAAGGDGRIDRAGAIALGYMTGLLVFGRENTAYWGELYAPLVGVGFALAPMAITDLARAAGLLGPNRAPAPALGGLVR